MRAVCSWLALTLGGCSTDNPLFGQSTTGSTTDRPGTETAAVTDDGKPSTSEGTSTRAEESGAPRSSSSTSGEASTGAPVATCCEQDICDPTIQDCLCNLSPDCCEQGWSGNCIDIAIECGASCPDVPRPCCRPHPEPGCQGVILDLPGFCQLNTACCLNEWTPVCVIKYSLAGGRCELLPCLEPHETPLCDDPTIIDCVCTSHPECCDEAWTQTCVDRAISCGA